jgi:AcrR family transcriptional regulator
MKTNLSDKQPHKIKKRRMTREKKDGMYKLSNMEVRKNKVIQSALKIFAEKGFQNTTITEISNHSKVSEASIYEYFGTK